MGGHRRGDQSTPSFPDAPFIQRFIAEVSKDEEPSSAVKGLGAYPLANWLHRFSDFRSVIDALRFALSLNQDMSTQRVLSSLKLDLEVTLSAFISKIEIDGSALVDQIRDTLSFLPKDDQARFAESMRSQRLPSPIPRHLVMASLVNELQLSADERSGIALSEQQIVKLGMYLLGGVVPASRIWISFLRQAAVSGSLLRYDPEVRSLVETELSAAVIDAIQEADSYVSRYEAFQQVQNEVLASVIEARQSGRQRLELRWEQAVVVWGMYHSQVNLYRRLASIYAYLRGTKSSPAAEE